MTSRVPAAVVLERDDIRLEPLAFDHVAGLHQAIAHAAVWAFTAHKRPASEDETRAFVAAALERRDAKQGQPFAIVVDGAVAGTTSYVDSDLSSKGSIAIGGTYLGKPWWRTHVNTTAKLLLLGHAFDECGYERVTFQTDVRNDRSATAIRRLGAIQEGVLRHHKPRPDGSWRDSVIFSILRDEWPAAKARLLAALEARSGATA